MKPTEIILRLDKMIKLSIDSLEEAAMYANKDDANGEAGRIAQEALLKLYDMYLELSKKMSNKNNNL